jgi:hypothetical protein
MIWQGDPKFFVPLSGELLKGEDLYKYQMEHLANAILLEDYDPKVEVDSCSFGVLSTLKFPPFALVSGSYIMHCVVKSMNNSDLKWDDIDVYFKSKDDARTFVAMNNFHGFDFNNPMCAYGYIGNGIKMNLIYGVEYSTPGNLISRFDIRACSMCVDPNTKTLYVVRGSVEDATIRKIITFNPVPRGISVRRLVKYVQKGFEVEKYQALFFTELIKTDIYKPELELLTKEY